MDEGRAPRRVGGGTPTTVRHSVGGGIRRRHGRYAGDFRDRQGKAWTARGTPWHRRCRHGGGRTGDLCAEAWCFRAARARTVSTAVSISRRRQVRAGVPPAGGAPPPQIVVSRSASTGRCTLSPLGDGRGDGELVRRTRFVPVRGDTHRLGAGARIARVGPPPVPTKAVRGHGAAGHQRVPRRSRKRKSPAKEVPGPARRGIGQGPRRCCATVVRSVPTRPPSRRSPSSQGDGSPHGPRRGRTGRSDLVQGTGPTPA